MGYVSVVEHPWVNLQYWGKKISLSKEHLFDQKNFRVINPPMPYTNSCHSGETFIINIQRQAYACHFYSGATEAQFLPLFSLTCS